jgi:hypothetical protein
LPDDQQHFLFRQEQIAVLITEMVRAAGFGLVLVGMVAEIKTLFHQILFLQGGFAGRIKELHNPAILLQGPVYGAYPLGRWAFFLLLVVSRKAAFIGTIFFITATPEYFLAGNTWLVHRLYSFAETYLGELAEFYSFINEYTRLRGLALSAAIYLAAHLTLTLC